LVAGKHHSLEINEGLVPFLPG